MIPSSDYLRDRQIVRGRIAIAVGGVLLLVAILIARLAYLQISQHQRFSTLAQNNRIDFVPMAPVRGLIYDRNGEILAENRRVYNVEILPDRVDDMNQLLGDLGQLIELSEEDVTRFKQLVRRQPSFDRQTL
ncbi:MAG: penicillin-binding protein 2, partial [Gammaproteobacteria bacterium]|nr:penicillin-binding protein 2 [Gammaproteobacteria bacterium]